MNLESPPTFPYSLVATDLDGTLLHSDLSISERSTNIISTLIEQGVTFVLVTARPPRVLQAIAHKYNFKGLAICCNGAIVYDLATETIIQHNPVPYSLALNIASTLKDALPGLSFAWERGLDFGWDPLFASLHTFATDIEVTPAEFSTLDQSPFSKLIVLHPDHPSDTLIDIARSHLGSTVTITHSGAPFIEISAKNINKAHALRSLAEHLSIPTDKILAFGDMPNDIQMLNLAGHSVATANAHPSVLAQADEITLTNDEDGVATVLERLLRTGC